MQGNDLLAFNSKVAAAGAFAYALMKMDGGMAAYTGIGPNYTGQNFLASINGAETLAAAIAIAPAAVELTLHKMAGTGPLFPTSCVARAASATANAETAAKVFAEVAKLTTQASDDLTAATFSAELPP